MWRVLPAPAGLLVALALAPAAEADHSATPSPRTHGPDPVALERLVEAPGPAGGRWGRSFRADGPLSAPQVLLSLPEQWCGTERGADGIGDEVPNGVHKYHAIYAHPADGQNRFLLEATRIQTDALQASALLERTYGVAIRFDMGTTCGPQFLDISSVRLTSSTAALQALAASGGDALFSALASELAAAGFDLQGASETAAAAAARTKNVVLWYDGPAPAAACGQGVLYDDSSRRPDNWNNYAGKLAVIFRSGSGFCNSNTVRHEIGHNLGALQPGAPHMTGGHCTDALEDTMCLPDAPSRGSGEYHSLYFDYGRDDYWDPHGGTLPHWTVNLSRFLCPTVDCNVPGGSASGGLLDGDGDGIPDILDPCPATRETSCPGTEPGADASQRQPAGVRIAVSARRTGGRWRLRIRLSGQPRARLGVRCGRRSVYRRSIAIPRTVRMTLRCRSRPRVSARWLRG